MHLDIAALARECAQGVHVATMAAIAHVESSGSPLAIGVNGAARISRQPRTAVEAVAVAKELTRRSVSFDLGIAQINSANLVRLGLSIESAFDPCSNLRAAATLLSWCYSPAVRRTGEGQAALQQALSCYNSGSRSGGLANGYVRKVYDAVQRTTLPSPPTPGGNGKATQGRWAIRAPPHI